MRNVSRTGIMAFAAGVMAVAFTAGCTTTAEPLRTEPSTSGIRAAEEAGAATVPQASLYLQLAREQLELARVLAAKGEKEKAASMLLRAEADAEVAAALARGDDETSEARAALERVRRLRQDNP